MDYVTNARVFKNQVALGITTHTSVVCSMKPTRLRAHSPVLCVQVCAGVPSDYVFVIDRSGSIGKTNAIIQEQMIKDMIETMVPQQSSVGIIVFSTEVESYVPLYPSEARATVLSKINVMPYPAGETYTEKALQTALTSSKYLGSPSVKREKRIVLVTDGRSTDNPCNLVNDISSMSGLKIVVLGISGGFVRSNVECLVQHQQNSGDWVLEMPAFSLAEFEKIRFLLEPKVCVVEKSMVL